MSKSGGISMSKKVIARTLIWLILTLGLTVITFFNYKIFIVDSVKQDIEVEEQNRVSLNRELKQIERDIEEYNKKIYEDNRYLLFIPEELNKSEIILDYVNAPLLKAGASLSSSISITEEMPNNITWSKNLNKNNIKGIKVSIVFDIPINKLFTYFEELQSTVRCIYIGDFKYTIPDNPTYDIKVTMSYYLFYKEQTT